MAQKFTDAARSELVSGIGPSDTSFDVLEGELFPEATVGAGALDEGDWFKVVIQGSDDLEICYVRTHSLMSAGAFSDVMRGQEGTTAASFGAGTVVGLRVTSVDLERFDPPEATKAQIEDDGNTTAYKMTPQRIWQAIAKWWDLNRPGKATGQADGLMSKEDKAKLESIAIGATANDTDADLRDRSTHTGMQILATISDAGSAASKDVPTSGNASNAEVVLGSDTRLSDARAPTSHTHTIANVTNLQSTLDGKAPTSHTHTIANVTGLQAALDAKTATYTTTTASGSKTLANRERCTVTAAGKTLTLPASPPVGAEVAVSIGGSFVNTVIARNNEPIMGLAENLTIDQPHVTVTFCYIDSTRGWRIF